LLFAFHTVAFADLIYPRIGLETELARHNKNGQILYAPSDDERAQKSRKILEFFQKIYGGTIGQYQQSSRAGQLYLDHNSSEAGEFRVDRDWASHLGRADAFEIVAPPLNKSGIDLFVSSYDSLLAEQNLGPGHKTSQQFNIELREIIDGLSLSVRPSDRLGIATKDINNLNISKVVELFLFCERNVLNIYAALAPKRLGNLVNYFSVPMIFEHDELLMTLAEMPESERTYAKVRAVFAHFQGEEAGYAKYGETRSDGKILERTPWKYRPFNMRKFFMLQEPNPTWIFPTLELRVPDTAESSEQLNSMLNFIYALFQAGSNAKTTSDDLKDLYVDYLQFLNKYRKILPFQKAMRLINQDIVSRSLTKDFQNGYKVFLKDLDLPLKNYPPFAGAEPTRNISRTYAIYNQIGAMETHQYMGRPVTIPKIDIPWDLTGYSFGAEFEFTETPGILDILKQIPFLEAKVTTEKTGNREVITKPTTNFLEYRLQVQYMRDVLGDKLRSVHGHTRVPKKIYDRIPKLKMNSWLGRKSDWITTLRANYRNPLYAFGTRTQNRMQVDTPNAWIADDKAEYRGTLRVLHFEDTVDFEVRGLMDGIFSQNQMSSDMFLVSHLILMMGLNQPEYVEGDYVLRLLSEVRNPSMSLRDMMSSFAESFNEKLDGLPHSPELLVSALRAPNLMLLPLVGFEYMPYLSAHDIKRLNNATAKWKFTVWSILSDRSLNADQAKQRFFESLKEWSQESGLEHAMFDSLLTSPAPGATWSDTHLPAIPMLPGFLDKILSLQTDDWVKSGFELFLVTWSSKDEKTLVTAAKHLDEERREKLLTILARHKEQARITALAKKLGIKAPAKAESSSEDLQTNLSVLIRNWTPSMTVSTPAIVPLVEEEPVEDSVAEQTPVQLATEVSAPAAVAEGAHPDVRFATAIADLQTYNAKLLPIVEHVKVWRNRFADGGISPQVYMEELHKSLGKWLTLSTATPAIQELENMELLGNVRSHYREYSVLNAQLSGIIEDVLVKNELLSQLSISGRIHFLKIWWHGVQPRQRQAGIKFLNQDFERLFTVTKTDGRSTSRLHSAFTASQRIRDVDPITASEQTIIDYLSFIEGPYKEAKAIRDMYANTMPFADEFLKKQDEFLSQLNVFPHRENKHLLQTAARVLTPKRVASQMLVTFNKMGYASFITNDGYRFQLQANLDPIVDKLDTFKALLPEIGIHSSRLQALYLDQARFRVLNSQVGRSRDAAPHIPYIEYLLQLRPGIQMQNLWQSQDKAIEKLKFQYSNYASVKHSPRHHVQNFGRAYSLLSSLNAFISSSQRFMTDERFRELSCEEALTRQ